MTVLEAVGVSKRFGDRQVLDRVGVVTSPGRALVLRGSNGTGKTTLLRCLAGAAPMDEGTVLLDDVPRDTASPAWWAQVHSVLDDFSWFPELTVGDHLRLLDGQADPEGALATFGAEMLVDRTAVSLSSGQMRRAALATTIVRPWRVLLLDEPEQRLDAQGLASLALAVEGFCAQGRAVVLSTHSDALVSLLRCDVVTLG